MALRLFRDFFDDVYSIVHVLYGFVGGFLEPLSATLVFVAYQYYEREPSSKKRGDFIEYAVGMIIGRIVWLVLRCVGLCTVCYLP